MRSILKRLKFLKGDWKLLALWPAMALLIIAIGWFIVFSWLDAGRQATEDAALREATASASAYADRLGRMLEAVGGFALHVRQAWELSQGAFCFEGMASEQPASRRWRMNVMIFDRSGRLVTSKDSLPKTALCTFRELANGRILSARGGSGARS